MKHTRTMLLAATALATATLATACGKAADQPASAASTTAASAPTTTQAASPSTAAKSTGGASVSVGDITPPGTVLKVGDTARIVYAESTDKNITVGVKAVSIVKGSQADLSGFNIDDAAMKQATPWYVTMQYTNLSGPALKYPYLNVKLKAQDATGASVNTVSLIGKFTPCQDGDKAASWDVGTVQVECKVFMAPPGSDVVAAAWVGDFKSKPVLWKP